MLRVMSFVMTFNSPSITRRIVNSAHDKWRSLKVFANRTTPHLAKQDKERATYKYCAKCVSLLALKQCMVHIAEDPEAASIS